MHKKIVALFALVALVCGAMFADVAVKALDGDNVEVTFTIKAPASQLVVITGPSPYFPNWSPDGIPMTKGDDGVWSYTLTAKKSDEIVYKFLLDGAWLADPNAPDTIDDGFGGRNGVVPVAAMVAAASGDTSALAIKAGPKFQTWSMLGAQIKFDTVETKDSSDRTLDDAGVDSAGIGLKSYWKFSGYAVDKVPIYVEVALAENEGFANLYQEGSFSKGVKKDPVREWKDGFTNLADLVFDPIYYLDGQAAAGTYLGHFKTGFESEWVNWTTGYKYAKLSPHTNVSWVTVDKEWEAGYSEVGGFNIFELGSALRNIGDVVTLNATIAPNRSADRAGNQYGMYAFVTAQTPVGYFDIQYNGAYGKTFDTMFSHIYETDVILGYKGTFGPVTVKMNGLWSGFGDGDLSVNDNKIYKSKYVPAASDVGPVSSDAPFLDGTASNVQVTYTADMFDVTLGFRHRGVQANMMYVEEGADDHTNISDQLGSPNTMKFWLEGNVTPIEMLSIGAVVGAEKTLDTEDLKGDAKSLMKLNIEPKVSVKLTDVIGIDSSVDAYGKMYAYTNDSTKFKRGTEDGAAFILGEAGLQYNMGAINDVIGGINVKYALDNGNDDESCDQLFNTLLAEVKLPLGFTVQAGFGLRTANGDADAPNAPFGAFLGAWKKLEVLQKPIVYAQCVYNMDPYMDFGDGQEQFNLDGYTLDNGVGNYEGAAAIRLAMRWEI